MEYRLQREGRIMCSTCNSILFATCLSSKAGLILFWGGGGGGGYGRSGSMVEVVLLGDCAPIGTSVDKTLVGSYWNLGRSGSVDCALVYQFTSVLSSSVWV